MTINRRRFLGTVAAAGAASGLRAQAPQWSSPVIDMHFHMRGTPEANAAHLDGCGVTMANLLTQAGAVDRVRAVQERYPKRFVWYGSTDITKPGAEALLTQTIKNGAGGIGELKSHVEADGPELRRMYALAAELDVPILIHFQEVPHTENEGTFASGFKRFEAILKEYPRTRFFGHADAFWANVSADYANQEAYPSGPIKRGGLTDKLLSDYPNLFADMSANSGNNALSRDPDFTPDFLKRHQDKLVFGSDCGCTDGNGGGVAQANNPAANRLSGKCVARETLSVLQKSTSPALFAKLVWENAHKFLRLPA